MTFGKKKFTPGIFPKLRPCVGQQNMVTKYFSRGTTTILCDVLFIDMKSTGFRHIKDFQNGLATSTEPEY